MDAYARFCGTPVVNVSANARRMKKDTAANAGELHPGPHVVGPHVASDSHSRSRIAARAVQEYANGWRLPMRFLVPHDGFRNALEFRHVLRNYLAGEHDVWHRIGMERLAFYLSRHR